MPKTIILTALEVEYRAVRAFLTDLTEVSHPHGTIYERGTFEANGRTWDIALAQVGMGNSPAAVEAERAIAWFDPDLALFVGVAGGLKDVQLGDVVAASKIYGYEFGKAGEQFLPRPEVGRTTHRMVQRARVVARNREWQKRILPAPGEPTPNALVAPLAAGSQVVASNRSTVFVHLRANYSDAAAVEMEGHGFLEATHANDDLDALVIRGISDLIEGKGETDAAGWQKTASRHAAAFAFEVLATHELPNRPTDANASGFETVDGFFRPFLDASKIFNHSYPLIDRNHYLDRLAAFVASPERISILSGRGGIGKSKIFKEGLSRIEAADEALRVRVLEDIGGFDRSVLEDLPDGRVMLAVDDTHKMKSDDLMALLSWARRHSDHVQLVLTTRPYGVPDIRQSLLDSRFTSEELLILPELAPMTRLEMIELASEVLGEAHAHLADRLVEITGDSPLVTVVAARLLVLEQIDPRQLVDAERAQDEIFGRFRDVLLGHLSTEVDPARARDALDLVSAIGPLRAYHGPLMERAATFLGVSVDQLHRSLSVLADAGALVLIGGTYRVTPDLLSRFVLKKAAVVPTGVSTGYADRMFETFSDLATEELLTNLVDILPGEVLRFARVLVERGDIHAPEPSLEAILEGTPDHPAKVLPRILRTLCSEQQFRRDALDLLWKLGRDDPRSPHQNVDHPIRVLQELADIEVGKEQTVYDDILTAVEHWIGEPNAYAHRFSPLDVLDRLLKKEASEVRQEGERITWQEYPVSSTTFGSVRRRSLRLLVQQSRSSDSVIQYRALTSLLDAIWRPFEVDARRVGEQEAAARTRENQIIFAAIRELIDRTGSRVITCAVERALRPAVGRAPVGNMADPHRQLLDILPADFDAKLVRYMWHGWSQHDFFTDEEGWDERRDAASREIVDVVQRLVDVEGDAAGVKTRLEEELARIRQHGVTDAHPGYVLETIAKQHPDLALQLSGLIIADPSSSLAGYLLTLLITAWDRDRAGVRRAIEGALAAPNALILAGVAITLANLGRLEEQERGVVRILAKRSEPAIVQGVLRALRRFPPEATAEVDEIAALVDIGGNPRLADELCEDYATRAKTGLSEALWRMLEGKLVPVDDLPPSGSPTHDLIDVLLQTRPSEAVGFFVERMRYETSGAHSGEHRYRSVPYASLAEFSSGDMDPEARRAALMRIGELMIDPEGLPRHRIVELFEILSNGFDVVSLHVLEQLIADEGRYGVQQVASLLGGAPETIAFDRPDFVARLLEAARAAGPDVLETMQSRLISRATSGGGFVEIGEPRPHLVALKRQAEAVAAAVPNESLIRSFYDELVGSIDRLTETYLRMDEELFGGR